MNSTTSIPSYACPHCSSVNSWIYHGGGTCPRVKSIEYQPNGVMIKKIEFHDARAATDGVEHDSPRQLSKSSPSSPLPGGQDEDAAILQPLSDPKK